MDLTGIKRRLKKDSSAIPDDLKSNWLDALKNVYYRLKNATDGQVKERMSNPVKTLLQKINFIETDMDLHKQILMSIPSDQKDEIEKTLTTIADMKNQIQDLRLKIKEIDGTEYDRIIAIERAANAFKKIAMEKTFVQVNTLNETGECFITLNDGTRMDCLVAAKEENGNWTIMTLDGETKVYPAGLIR